MTDQDIIGQILHGEKEKFRILVEKYQNMVFRTCNGFVHNKDDADDLTQDTFIRAYKSLADFKGDAAFSTWIYRIAINISLNNIRKSSSKNFLSHIGSIFGAGEDTSKIFQISETDNPESILIRHEHVELLQKALNKLPENQRTAIVLSKYDNLSQKEIAEIMNTSEGAVEALLHRAKKNLRNNLSGYKK